MNTEITIKQKNKNKLLTNVPNETWQRLKALAAIQNVSLSEMIKILVEFFILKTKGE